MIRSTGRIIAAATRQRFPAWPMYATFLFPFCDGSYSDEGQVWSPVYKRQTQATEPKAERKTNKQTKLSWKSSVRILPTLPADQYTRRLVAQLCGSWLSSWKATRRYHATRSYSDNKRWTHLWNRTPMPSKIKNNNNCYYIEVVKFKLPQIAAC